MACAPGEQHDLPLIAFGLALRSRGWRIVFLGADSPAASIAETAERLRLVLVVVSSVTPRGFRREADAFAALAREHRLVIAGAGATERLAESLGSSLLQGDPVAAAGALEMPRSVRRPSPSGPCFRAASFLPRTLRAPRLGSRGLPLLLLRP